LRGAILPRRISSVHRRAEFYMKRQRGRLGREV
jgi:hypothetical protein